MMFLSFPDVCFCILSLLSYSDRGYTDLAEITVAQDKPLGRWGKLASSDAGSNIESGSSLVTLELPPEPLAELVNVMDLYRSLFGITPDVCHLIVDLSLMLRLYTVLHTWS